MDRQVKPPSLETSAETALIGAAAPAPAPESNISQLTSSSSSVMEEGRFAPGTLLGGRYRILGLLGRGGMGEVYRATDLMLGQAVALKFLPVEASQNPRLLERFHGEVRVARLVSHPNVCRVFDIGQVDGTPFISMEYVDGEDLASLLLRIGRLPADKALEIARKLCAGLAAAHDRGVIHRDFKPQNIMINKRGDAVIMDFGLAAIADQLSGAEVRNGTPAYMAPEQLKGAGVTNRSDIYALGLVLYELFTGRKPYEAKTLQQLIDLQESVHLASMISIAADVDPGVEKVIRRCLDPDSGRRPATALAVAAALPGGDPLAAALAAGETPSPEMVASAGKVEGLPRKISVPCLAVIAVCLFGASWHFQRTNAVLNAPLEIPPDVLAHQGRQFAASFGYPAAPADTALWLEHRSELLTYLSELKVAKNWTAWLSAEAPLRAVYRESPNALVAEPRGYVERERPPLATPGMVEVSLDGNGKLLYFTAFAPEEALPAPVDPDVVFRAAGFDRAAFQEIASTLRPAHASDTVRAWTGTHPAIPNTPVTLQVASWKGRITEVLVTYPYNAQKGVADKALLELATSLFLKVFAVFGALMVLMVARRNWKQGRTDRPGALRVAAAQFLIGFVGWAGIMHPVADWRMTDLLQGEFCYLLGGAAILWLVYLAIEPAVRARFPHSIVTWNRLLAGRYLDAQLWSEVLIGAAVGCFIRMAMYGLDLIGPRDVLKPGGVLDFLLGTRHWWGGHALFLHEALTLGLMVFAVLCGIRGMVRNDYVAAVATALIFTATEGVFALHGTVLLINLALLITVYTIVAFLLMRIGLVVSMSAIYFANGMNAMWLGSNWKAWYAPTGIATLVLLLGIAAFAFWRSLGGRELLGSGEEVTA